MKVCGVNAICPGDGLYFAGPMDLGRPGLRDRLQRDGRLQEVTVSSLVKLGVKSFCWLSPAERFEGLADADGSAWQHGAFIYCYNQRAKDCLFPVVETPGVEGDKKFTVKLDKIGGMKLGARLEFVDVGLRITEVMGKGLFAEWNKHHFDDQVMVNDIVVSVNGERVYKETKNMEEAMKKDGVLEIVIQREGGQAEEAKGKGKGTAPTENAVVPFSVACGKGRGMILQRRQTPSGSEVTDFTCKVCLDRQIEVVLIPCGHLCLCKTCAGCSSFTACPVCRADVRQRVNVFV